MQRSRSLVRTAAVACVIGGLMLTGACGAGSKTAEKTATKVGCDIDKPAQATTVNILAYNSSAIDPYTNTMIASCTGDNLTLKHDPIDFGGQVQKTAATLAGDTGTYDLIEEYSAGIPQYAKEGKLLPLDDLFAKYKDKYSLGDLDQTMLKGMSYDGKLYGLPTQANISIWTYRKDVFDEMGLSFPKDFDELKQTVAKIQKAGKYKYPLAMPLLSSGDITTRYNMGMYSQGKDLADGEKSNFNTPQSKNFLDKLHGLAPYMDPQVTTFDQPKVQQQLFNGNAVIAEMYSGRMVDLINAKNTKFSDKFGFAMGPTVEPGGDPYSTVSVDGWSIPKNAGADPDLLFQLMAASVAPKAAEESIPAAYPSRGGVANAQNVPWFDAIDSSIKGGAPTPPMKAWYSEYSIAVRPFISQAVQGQLSVDDAAAKAAKAHNDVLAKYAGK
ncbi:MAG: ABC transporter substrate-binding protein [Propionibacteriaceae bacterium]